MAKVTKKILEQWIESACEFQKCDIVLIRKYDISKLRLMVGFVPVACYGRGQIPLESEIGRIKNKRILGSALKKLDLR